MSTELEPCSVQLNLKIRPSEAERLIGEAGNRPVSAVVRERLGLAPAVIGRRWPADPAERRWRTREPDTA
jgi:hypothetical protein